MSPETISRRLLCAEPVRSRAHEALELCRKGELEHWSVDLDQLPHVADKVLNVTRSTYPDLVIPFHSRWRHFELVHDEFAPGRTPAFFRRVAARDRGRAAYDLAVASVLLDAGAGPAWRYRGRRGDIRTRSEGLALATLDMFCGGLFSSSRDAPLRVDAEGLERLAFEDLEAGFQVRADNRLTGLRGRHELLRALGRALRRRPDVFVCDGVLRPGALFDLFTREGADGPPTASRMLETLLDVFGGIWPSGTNLAGVPLGDVWRLPALKRDAALDGLVPFHKLSQWLTYSLIEPIEWAGGRVAETEALTGLPEYRNGGLFIDLGALAPRRPGALDRALQIGDPATVELRALTVALLDLVADRMRAALGVSPSDLPLARVLQGGTWAAGRAVAQSLRPDGSPPFSIVSDGTVF